jgi:FkbM family methyltransferase
VAYLRKIFPQSLIYSFEPDPKSFTILSEKGFEKHICFNLAVSDNTGKANFFRNEISHTNSLFKINIKSSDSIKISEDQEKSETDYSTKINKKIEVNTIRLDDIVEQEKFDKIDLLKIDVQGAEAQVLRGGTKALKLTSAIIMEVSLYDYYENRTSFYDVEKLLLPAGFKLFSILEISQNPMNGRTDWVESLYIRNRKYPRKR